MIRPIVVEPPAPPVCVSVAGNTLTLFVESPPLIEAMLADIRSATTRVWLETYIFLDDEAGRAIAEALIDRARNGVDVRVHFDSIGSMETPSTFFDELRAAGIQVHAFHSLWEAFYRFAFLRVLNRRNHRKLLVIDDRVGYFGGMNIIAPSNAERVGRAESVGWRDIHVRLEGCQQGELAESFERAWRMAHRQKIAPRSKEYREARLVTGSESIQFFDSGPGLRHTRAGRVFLQLIQAARRSLNFSMAYFLPVGKVRRALFRAPRRGVFVRVVIPGESDVPLVQRATNHLYSVMLRKRMHVYERQRHMLHSKVMVVDDQWTVLGSSNLDARSLWINLEFLAVIQSRPLAAAVNAIIRHEIAHSRRIRLRDCLNRPFWDQMVDGMAWLLRWWL